MTKVSPNIESLLAQCDQVYSAFQEDRVPIEHPNWQLTTYHQSYLLSRIQDLRAIIERLGAQNARLIELSHQIDRLTPQARPQRRFSKRLQAVHQQEGELTSLMQLDMESLLVFGNMTLDQWALFTKLRFEISGSHKNWQHPFSEFYRQVTNNQNHDSAVANLRSAVEMDVWWLQFNVRSYRNTFVEHLDRPWQRGTSRPVYLEGFNFFIPVPAGSLSKADVQALYQPIEHLVPASLTALPDDHWQRRPSSIVQWLVHHIDTIPQASDRKLIGEAWEQIGGETVSYTVMAERILRLLNKTSKMGESDA